MMSSEQTRHQTPRMIKTSLKSIINITTKSTRCCKLHTCKHINSHFLLFDDDNAYFKNLGKQINKGDQLGLVKPPEK